MAHSAEELQRKVDREGRRLTSDVEWGGSVDLDAPEHAWFRQHQAAVHIDVYRPKELPKSLQVAIELSDDGWLAKVADLLNIERPVLSEPLAENVPGGDWLENDPDASALLPRTDLESLARYTLMYIHHNEERVADEVAMGRGDGEAAHLLDDQIAAAKAFVVELYPQLRREAAMLGLPELNVTREEAAQVTRELARARRLSDTARLRDEEDELYVERDAIARAWGIDVATLDDIDDDIPEECGEEHENLLPLSPSSPLIDMSRAGPLPPVPPHSPL